MNRKDKREMKRMISMRKRMTREKGLEIGRVDEGERNKEVRESE